MHLYFPSILSFALLGLASPFLNQSTSPAPTVYLIRHGEKPADGGNGLTEQGRQRAQCLRNIFSASSQYKIGYVIAEQPRPDGSRARPYMTVQPVAQDLGLTVDTGCKKNDPDCVAELVLAYSGSGGGKNVLICWEHNILTDIVRSLGADEGQSPVYPSNLFHLIWTDPAPYTSITSTTSQHCPGLDS